MADQRPIDPIKALKNQAWDLKRAGAPGTVGQLQGAVTRAKGYSTDAAFRAAHRTQEKLHG